MKEASPHLSIVTPFYKGRECVEELYKRVTTSVGAITESYEIIMVDDACPDNSWELIEKITAKDKRVKGIRLSRNFGQHYALTAGLDYAEGDWVIVMDCDLQDLPEDIPKLYEEAQKGFDIVLGRRTVRKDSFLKKLGSRMFFIVFNKLTGVKQDPSVGNFRIMNRNVVLNFRRMREQLRFFSGLVHWLGFQTGYVEITHAERFAGETAYNLKRMLRLAFDAMIEFSDKPLKLSVNIGMLLSCASFVYGLFLVYKKLFLGRPVEGWTSIMVSLYFLGGLILLNLGVIGLYLGKVFENIKGRPLYIIKDRINL